MWDIAKGNHGALTAGSTGRYPAWCGGIQGGLMFNGSTDGHVTLDAITTLYSAARYTALVWFRPAFVSLVGTGQSLLSAAASDILGISGYNRITYYNSNGWDRLFADRDYIAICKSDGSNTETLWLNGAIQSCAVGAGDKSYRYFGRRSDYSVYYEGKIFLVRTWDRALTGDEIRALSINPYLGIVSPRAASYFIRRGKAWSATFAGVGTVAAGAPMLYRGFRATAGGSTTISAAAMRLRGVSATVEGATEVSAHCTGRLMATATAAGSSVVAATMGFKVAAASTVAGVSTVGAAARVSKIPPYVWTLPVFSFEPDWSHRPKLGMTFITDVQTSDSGAEERNARLDRPKLSAEHKVAAWEDHAVARSIEQFIEANIGKSVLVPMWSEAVPLTAAPSGTTIAVTAGSSQLFQPTRPVMLWKSPSVYSLLEISAAGATSLTSVLTAPAGYVAGDLAVPVFVSEPIKTGMELQWLNAFQASGSASFKEAAIETETLPFTVTLAEYRDLPIFPFPFNWSKGFQAQRNQRVDTVESETSIVAAVTAEDDPRVTAPGTVWLDDRADIARAWALFCGRRGRQSCLWLPSGKRDLVLTAAQPATSNQLVCSPSGYVTGDYLRVQRRVLLIVAEGAWYARLVTDAQYDAYGNEVLTLESTVPALPADAVISMLLLTRFDVDDISLVFNHNSQSDWETTLAELPAEYAALLTGTDPADGVLAENNVLLPAA